MLIIFSVVWYIISVIAVRFFGAYLRELDASGSFFLYKIKFISKKNNDFFIDKCFFRGVSLLIFRFSYTQTKKRELSPPPICYSVFFPCFKSWFAYTAAAATRTPCTIAVNTASSIAFAVSKGILPTSTQRSDSTIPITPRQTGMCLSCNHSAFFRP